MRLKSLLETLGTESWEWCYEMNRTNGQFDEKSMTGAHWSGIKLESSFACQPPHPLQALLPIRVTGVVCVQSNKCKTKNGANSILGSAWPFFVGQTSFICVTFIFILLHILLFSVVGEVHPKWRSSNLKNYPTTIGGNCEGNPKLVQMVKLTPRRVRI